MIEYSSVDYESMLGNIDEQAMESSVSCVSQCTGCMCNCRCSCSGGKIESFEWEVF